VTTTQVIELISAELSNKEASSATASVVNSLVGNRDSTAALAQIACDAALVPRTRVVALAALAELTLSGPEIGTIDAGLVELCDEDTIIDAALRDHLEHGLTETLNAHPEDATAHQTRRLIAHLLIAADRGGPHVTRLLVDARDCDAAAIAMTEDFLANIAGLHAAHALAQSWARATARWLGAADAGEFREAFVQVAPGLGSHLCQILHELFRQLPDDAEGRELATGAAEQACRRASQG